jgi:hypothetical protein
MFCSGSGGSENMASIWGVPFLGRIPFDSALTDSAERGAPLPDGAKASPAIARVVQQILLGVQNAAM